MAASVNRITDDWMQERSQAPLDKMKGWVATAARDIGDVVTTKIGIAHAGKKLLDEGGEAAELEVLAKKVALDAVALDKDVLRRIDNVACLYKEAADLLQNHTSGFGQLIAAYAERSKMYSCMLDSAGEAPAEPSVTDVELNAMKFVQLRQAQAQLGLRQRVGGKAAGRHGSSFFNCVEKDDRPQRNIAHEERHYSSDGHARASSLPPAVTDWNTSPGSPAFGQSHSSSSSHAHMQRGEWSFHEAMSVPPTCVQSAVTVRSTGASMASRIEMATDGAQQRSQASTPPKTVDRTDTLDTINTCMSSLNNLKAVIDTVDAPAARSEPIDEAGYESEELPTMGKDASYPVLPGTGGRATSPLVPSDSFSIASEASAPVSIQRQPISDSFSVASGSIASGANPTFPSTTSYRYAAPSPDTAVSESMVSSPAAKESIYNAPIGESMTVASHSSSQPHYPSTHYPSTTSYAIGAVSRAAPESREVHSRPSEGNPYKVGDPCDVFSQSSSKWVPGKVISVDRSVLIVQYGDRERKIDLKSRHTSSFFRSSHHRAHDSMLTSAPAPTSQPQRKQFDSMLTHADPRGRADLSHGMAKKQGGMMIITESAASVEPRLTKATVL